MGVSQIEADEPNTLSPALSDFLMGMILNTQRTNSLLKAASSNSFGAALLGSAGS